MFSIKGLAQEPGSAYVFSDKTTLKGRKELRHEKRIKRMERKNAKEQERKAVGKKKVRKYTVSLFPHKRKKVKSKESKKNPKQEKSKTD